MANKVTFESALKRLDQIAAALDSGEVSLEESLNLYKEGAQLVALCTEKLEQAKLTVETLFPAAPGEDGDE